MPKYRVLSPIEYGTKPDEVKRYEVDETIEIDDKTSVQLLAHGAIAPLADAKTPAKAK